jgi:ribonuclease HI
VENYNSNTSISSIETIQNNSDNRITETVISKHENIKLLPKEPQNIVTVKKSPHTSIIPSPNFNTIKLFGVHSPIQTKWDLFKICNRIGIPYQETSLVSFQKIGYRSKLFDSRAIKLVFTSHTVAYSFHIALNYAQKFKFICKNWRHTCSYSDTLNINSNMFSSLSREDPTDNLLDNAVSHISNINNACNNRDNVFLSRVGTWNIQSITKKYSDIINFMIEHSVQILAVTETRWTGNMLQCHNKNRDYHWFGKKSTQHVGGVGFIIHSSILEGKEIKIFDSSNQNTSFILIKGTAKNRSTLFCVGYGPANKKESDSWWDTLQNDLDLIKVKIQSPFDIIFMGDFNSRIGSAKCDSEKKYIGTFGEQTRDKAGKNALNFMIRNDLVCINNRKQPTDSTNFTYHQQGRSSSKSIIDLIILSEGMVRKEYIAKVLSKSSLTGCESHFPVVADIRIIRKISKEKQRFSQEKWNLHRFKSQESQSSFIRLRDKYLTSINVKNNKIKIDDLTSRLSNAFNKAGGESIGKIKNTFLQKSGYVNTSKERRLNNLLKQYKTLLKKVVSGKSDRNGDQNLKLIRDEIKKEKKCLKNSDLHKLATKLKTLHECNNSKDIYASLNNYAKQKLKPDITALRDKSGKVHSNTKKLVEIMRDKWSHTFKKNTRSSGIMPKFSISESDLNDKITKAEVKNSILSLQTNKSAGIDNIPAEFLINPSETVVDIILEIFNKIYESGEFPQDWKTDRKIPIFKKGDKLNPDNYRPIAVHSVFRKIYCKIIYDRINNQISLHRNQYGFRKDKRCSDHAAVIREQIYKHHKLKKLGKLFIAVFDFHKAFDSCDFITLINKLKNKGISGKLLRTVAAIYTNPKSKVNIQGAFSKEFKIERGVAQGCKLSTLLFNIYVNDLLEILNPEKDKISLDNTAFSYADDLILISNSEENLKKSIRLIEKWCDNNFFKINGSKSNIMVVNPGNHQHKFMINNQLIPIVDQIKYLGFIISNSGSWDPHITHCINKTYGVSKSWYDILKSNKLPFSLKLQIADAIILSHLRYGEEIFALNTTQISKLQSSENKILKLILGVPHKSSTNHILHILGRLSVENRLSLRKCTNFCRIERSAIELFGEMLKDNVGNSNGYLASQMNRDISRIFRHKPDNIISQQDIDDLKDISTPIQKCKSTLKRIFRRYNNDENYRIISHKDDSHIAQIIPRIPDPHLLKMFGNEYSSLLSWKLGNREKFYSSDSIHDSVCIICDTVINEHIHKHLLSDCPGTIEIVQRFYDELQKTLPEYFELLMKTNPNRHWIWILSCGINSEPHKKLKSLPITEGESITGKTEKTKTSYKIKALKEYEKIVSKIPSNALQIYTDGSKTKHGSGSGAVIYFGKKVIKKLSIPLKNCENNFAEMYAIHASIKWIQKNMKNYGIKFNRSLHLFTDSKISIDALCLRNKTKKNHRLINIITNELSKLNSPKLVLHWTPSHIEMKRQYGSSLKGIKGNMIADRLANNATYRSNEQNVLNPTKFFEDTPQTLVKSVAALVNAIDIIAFKKVIELKSSKPIGPSSDDFSLTDAKRSNSSLSSSVTS